MKQCMLTFAILAALLPAMAAAQSTETTDPRPRDTTEEPVAVARDADPLEKVVEPDLAEPDPDPGYSTAKESAPDDPFVLFHLGGFADASYVNTRGSGTVGEFTVAPIFHLLFGDRVLFESELEIEGNDAGESEVAVEYAAINWFVNDYATLVVGRFLSPTGFFSPNQHPSWINKLASVPPGFGHAGAAPGTDFGVQLRGGKTFDNGQNFNYAVYFANGPQLGLEGADGLDLRNEGATGNPDGKRVAGGRVGWLPIPTLEIGASLARGDIVLDPGELSQGPEPSRSYKVDGIDVAWRPINTLDLRAEWIRQRIGAGAGSLVPDQAAFRAWFVQGAYRFGADKWEGVLRYGDSLSPHGESTFKQTALGLNYLFRPNFKLKLTREFNRSANAEAGADRLLLQLAYGF